MGWGGRTTLPRMYPIHACRLSVAGRTVHALPVAAAGCHPTIQAATPTPTTTQVGTAEEGGATVEAVDMHLNMLRGAVAAYGGSVDVLSVEQVGSLPRFQYALPICHCMPSRLRASARRGHLQ